jgi:DNA modification methylase
MAKELYRVTKDGGIVVWVVGDQIVDGGESGNSFRQALKFQEIGFKIYDTMIYHKNGAPFPETGRYSQVFEYMFILLKGKKPNCVNIIKDKENNGKILFGALLSTYYINEDIMKDYFYIKKQRKLGNNIILCNNCTKCTICQDCHKCHRCYELCEYDSMCTYKYYYLS